MDKAETIDPGRRKFLIATAAALLAGAGIQIAGCSTDDDEPDDITAYIVDNHGHSAIVTHAQLESGGGLTLDIRGSAGHTHTVVLTAENLKGIAAGDHVMMNSSLSDQTPGHLHVVMFN